MGVGIGGGYTTSTTTSYGTGYGAPGFYWSFIVVN
jgi:hypothetical protein